MDGPPQNLDQGWALSALRAYMCPSNLTAEMDLSDPGSKMNLSDLRAEMSLADLRAKMVPSDLRSGMGPADLASCIRNMALSDLGSGIGSLTLRPLMGPASTKYWLNTKDIWCVSSNHFGDQNESITIQTVKQQDSSAVLCSYFSALHWSTAAAQSGAILVHLIGRKLKAI